jgi:HK97 family phage major capsid protein
MPTLLDIQTEVQTLFHDMQNRVTDLDKEQKHLKEELTSKTGAMPAEYKSAIDAMNAKINEQIDAIDKLKLKVEEERIASQRPPLDGRYGKKERSEQHKQFMKAIRKQGKMELMLPQERNLIVFDEMPVEMKALYAGDATTGGFFAATDFVNELLEYRLLISKMRSICRIQTTSGEKVQMPALANDATAFWQSEQSSFNASQDPTISMVNIPVHELRGLLKVSQQNLEDSMFNLEDLIKERLMLQFAKTEGAAFINGNANGKPRGLLNYPTQATTTFSGGSAGKNNPTTVIAYVLSGAATGKINADDVLNVKMDLKADYDPMSTYIFTRGTLNTIRLFKDSQNRPLWQPFAGANLPSLIYDAPYVEMPDMPEIASAAFPIAVGDFKQYMIVDRINMAFQQLNELYIASGLIGFIARMRLGGDVLVPEAFRLLKVN